MPSYKGSTALRILRYVYMAHAVGCILVKHLFSSDFFYLQITYELEQTVSIVCHISICVKYDIFYPATLVYTKTMAQP